ncbi:MAG TPA: integrin alpha [Anaerolineae bacterium]|nr:integrin alpha [Anaerolineae bacterium]
MKRWHTAVALVVVLAVSFGIAGSGASGQALSEEHSMANASLTFLGEDIGDWSGYSVSPAGDVNADGYDDLLIGAPYAGEVETKGPGKGYLILGRNSSSWPATHIDLAAADASFLGDLPVGMTARQVYTAGDVNGDGYDDFLISSWKYGGERGMTALFLGRASVNWGQDYPLRRGDATFLGEEKGDRAGYYVSAAGDVNADGYDDFLITAVGNDEGGGFRTGETYLILGRAAADWGRNFYLSGADASFRGEAEGDAAGRSATGVGDINADGYADFMIGAPFNDEVALDAGQAYLLLGRATVDWGANYPLSQADASFLGEAVGNQAGRRVSGAGDVNADGYDDIILGASYNDQVARDAGKAYLLLGSSAASWGMDYPLSQADAAFLGENLGDQAGRRVSDAGDVNADGYSDFLIAAPHNNRAAKEAGTAYLLLGRPSVDWGPNFSLAQADAFYVGESAFDHAGYDLSAAGDLDGDGRVDLVFGAYGADENGPQSGNTHLFLSAQAPFPVSFTPDAPSGKVGEWHLFTNVYRDATGWADISTAEMLLGRSSSDVKGLYVQYRPAENHLYLRDRYGTAWLGPCVPGEATILGNGIVQLDCALCTATNDGGADLQLALQGRWGQPITLPWALTAHLRATDQAGNDSGFLGLGTWTLNP